MFELILESWPWPGLLNTNELSLIFRDLCCGQQNLENASHSKSYFIISASIEFLFSAFLAQLNKKVCTSVKTNPYIRAGFIRLAKSGYCVLLQSKTFSLHGNASAGSWELGFPSLLQHPPIKFTWVCTQERSRINMLLDFLELSVCAFGSSFFEICFTKPLLLLAFVFGKGRFCFHDFYGNNWKV